MADKKIIAVVGATGAQGGGLVRAIMSDPNSEFTARAITRDPSSDGAKALAALGAEVVAADIDDEASVRSAFEGAYGAFCVTFFWAHFSPETEQAEAGNMARAAKTAGLKHVIWSTLEDTRGLHPAERRPHADPAGQVEGARTTTPRDRSTTSSPTRACRRRSCRRRSTGRTSSTSGWAPSAGRTASCA